jgi:hypothetical protein
VLPELAAATVDALCREAARLRVTPVAVPNCHVSVPGLLVDAGVLINRSRAASAMML